MPIMTPLLDRTLPPAYLNGHQISDGRSDYLEAVMSGWTAAEVPVLTGRVAVVTGANAGIGLETVRVLAQHGATVMLACRDERKADQAVSQIRSTGPDADVRPVHLDLASLGSVRQAAAEILAHCPRLDLLINNAGVMYVPFQRTEDGFELTLGTNHLGHFALTGLLLPRLLDTPDSRVVTMSSVAHRYGKMHFDDLNLTQHYEPGQAYGQSKLANLLFSYELGTRLAAAGARTHALAAHPGIVLTGLWRTSAPWERVLISPRLRLINFWAAQRPSEGALPTLRAATDPAARGGEYYGPGGFREYTGDPVRVESTAASHDPAAQRQLWDVSEQLTGVSYAVTA
jgi:NAD(P)-dependent dehydrogenase (short-subunit alcohol dehydrogenase family)